MSHALNTLRRGPRVVVVAGSLRARLRRARLVRRLLNLRKPLLVTSVLCMGLCFAASASLPTQNDASASADSDWDVRRDLHDCAHVAGPPARICVAYVKASRSAEREVLAAPASAYWRDETRLLQADRKYMVALDHCAELDLSHQVACRDVARQERVQPRNETRRAGLRAEIEFKAARSYISGAP